MTPGVEPGGASGAAGAAGDLAPLVSLAGVSAGYGAAPILSEITFDVLPGQRIAVLGPNGGGKTTLMRVLLGLLPARTGTVSVPAVCGLVPQTERSRLDFPVTALDVALMGTISSLPWWRRPGAAERLRATDALEAVGLGDRAGDAFGSLSGGQRQRVLVARALVQDARVILLDEPFTGLDAVSHDRLERLLADLAGEGRALLIATHDVKQARRYDAVLCINRRQVAFGPADQVLDTATLRATYGADLVAIETNDAPGGAPLLGAIHHHCDHDEGGHGHDHGDHAHGDPAHDHHDDGSLPEAAR